MSNIFEARRSVNFFNTKKALDENTVKDIINLAVTAPSAFNLQPWEIIVVQSDEAKQKLFEQSNDQAKVLEAPVTLIIIGHRNGAHADNKAWAEMEKAMGDKVQGYKDFAAFLYGSTEERKIKFAESNAGLLGMSIMYAAKHFEVDSHPMSGIDFDGIKKAFNIDDDKDVVMTIALGYHDESQPLYPRAYRKYFDDVAVVV